MSSSGSPPPASTRSPREHAALDRPGGADLGAEAVARPERVQRVERRHDLRHRGRRQRRVRAGAPRSAPPSRSASAKPVSAPEPRGGEDRLERLGRGAGARAPAGAASQAAPPASTARRPTPRHRRHTPSARSSLDERSSIRPLTSVQAGGARNGKRPRLGLRQPPAREAPRRRREPGAELVARPRQHAHRHRRMISAQRSQRWKPARLSAPISQTKRTPG